MASDRSYPTHLSEFMQYLASYCTNEERLPTLVELSQRLGISVAILREQLEVARALGLVEVRPRTGIRALPYTFRPAAEQSLTYAVAKNPSYFESYAELRQHIEVAYWYQAVNSLIAEDHEKLQALVSRAFEKLHGYPVQIPQLEHRNLHLMIYKRLNNPFVTGLLETYWDLYEAVGLNVYTDISYLERVWQYHRVMVESIGSGNYAAGYQALVDHHALISQRSHSVHNQKFE
jgi:DNA-binding FadR family transcriptional regulator